MSWDTDSREGHKSGTTNIDETARTYYRMLLAKGRNPSIVTGGALDGLPYFEIELDDTAYWVTEIGLIGREDMDRIGLPEM